MVNVQVNDSEWLIALKYWQDLQKHLNQADDLQKIEFLNRIIFESTGLNTLDSQSSLVVTTTKTKPKTQTKAALFAADGKDRIKISSISIATMSEIMNEIDNELEERENTIDDEMKIDSKIKTFIVEPV